jgi:hypothetical protein
MSRADAFDEIYKKRVWGDGQMSPLSGSGSLPDNAKPYVDYVKAKISELNIKSVVDVGHGDWSMWEHYKFDQVTYIGIEVSSQAHEIAKNRNAATNKQFILEDLIVSRRVPECDLIISKDCLQHLPNRDVEELLGLFSKANFVILCNDIYVPFNNPLSALRHYLRLRTRISLLMDKKNPLTYWSRLNNSDIEPGEFRGLDLETNPFVGVLSAHNLVHVWDFDGPWRHGMKKRVYFFSKI